ncbi:putative fatty acyl-CoA reductase CG5065 [Orussus abietinus]|uniref:putative fatty acyl-CoA reductase CG5065 n=1 Tax=Orussus abietinus TaxID=222816 RepID=UPI000626BF0A|nr:putative fatty acyl-CoA reductase CG5065 [Orussus abietinus]
MEELTEIQSFYKGKTLFITGGSGFMGKVLVEKLLFSCSDLDKIYLLLRPKRGRTPELRVDDMFKSPMFNRVRKLKPQVFKKVVPLLGDVTLENLGLTQEQLELLENEVHVFFHGAATLRLEAKLKDAIEMNTVGTKRVLDLAKRMKKLQAFVHLSTAFCHVDQAELGERVYDSPDDPQDVMRLIQWMDESALDLVTPKLLDPHPNTYTYSKRLAETLVANEYPNLPCAIARPSIVTPSWVEPLPGWVDSLNGPVGLIVAAGKGVIRSMHCNANYHAEVIPVDMAINALIAIAHRIGTNTLDRSKNMPVFNITQSGVKPITWGEILEKGKKVAHEYPFEGAIWFPDGDIRTSKFVHNLIVFFFHILPAYFIDFLMLIFRQKRFMVRIQKRISDGLEVLQYFTTREWVFHNTNLLILWGEMNPRDKKIFPIDFLVIDEVEYMKKVILGARQYCMKEDLSTLPKARTHQKILYVLHVTTVYLFYFGILYFIYKQSEVARFCLDSVTEKMKSLPIIGGLANKAHL